MSVETCNICICVVDESLVFGATLVETARIFREGVVNFQVGVFYLFGNINVLLFACAPLYPLLVSRLLCL